MCDIFRNSGGQIFLGLRRADFSQFSDLGKSRSELGNAPLLSQRTEVKFIGQLVKQCIPAKIKCNKLCNQEKSN